MFDTGLEPMTSVVGGVLSFRCSGYTRQWQSDTYHGEKITGGDIKIIDDIKINLVHNSVREQSGIV